MDRWKIKELAEMDDITFAMCILSERREKLNQNAPLAQKLAKAYAALDDIRGGLPMVPPGNDMRGSLRERIYRDVENDYLRQDIESHILNEEHDLRGMAKEDVLADRDIMDQIEYRYGKCESDHWDNLGYAIEQGIKEVMEKRNK